MQQSIIDISDEHREAFADTIAFFGVAPRQLGIDAANQARFLEWTTLPLEETCSVGGLIAAGAFTTGASAVTFRRTIYFQPRVFERSAVERLRLAFHELAHVVQYLRDGTIPFLRTYLADYVRNLLQGYTERDAYRSITSEIEARKVADYACRISS
jgi:hypothetical protein